MSSRSASALLLAVALAAIVAVLWPRGSPEQAGPTANAPRAERSAGSAVSGAHEKLVDRPAASPLAAPARGGLELLVTAAGRPVEGAAVQLYQRGPRDLSTGTVEWRAGAAGTTGKDGTLRLEAATGTWLVAARAAGFAKAQREVTRPVGEERTRMALELSAGSSLRGRTVTKGARKEPVPLCQLTLVYGGASATLRPPTAPPQEQLHAQSDERGQFQLDGLAPGHYHLEAKAGGFGSARIGDLLVPHAQELQVELPAASFIEGRVVEASGAPAAGAAVFAVGSPDEPALTAAGGAFSLEVAPRTWRLQARRGAEAGSAEAPVAVAAGATARGVKIVLGPSGSFVGTAVSASTGKPIAGITVAISPHNENGDSGRSVSDVAGAFAVSGLAPGSYDLDAKGAGYSAEERRGLVLTRGARFEVRLELKSTGSARGVVRDGSGRAVEGALVRGGFDRDNTQAEARTDPSGAYQLSGLPAGRTPVQARREGSVGGELATLDIPEGGSAEHDFTLSEEGTLTGTLSRASGEPGPQPDKPVLLRLFQAGSGRRPVLGPDDTVLPVDGQGRFSGRVQAGTYNLLALYTGGGWATSPAVVNIEPNQTTVKDLTLLEAKEGPAGLTGQVLEPDGTPSPFAQVRLFTAGGGRFFTSLSADESGQFRLDRPRADLPDSIDLRGQNGGRSGTASVGPGETRAVLQLRPGATLSGSVLSSGRPVQGFSISWVGAALPGSGGSQTLEFPGDQFELRDLPASQIALELHTPDGRTGDGSITLSEGQAAQLDLTLIESASISGRVVDAETRQPLAGVEVGLGEGPKFEPTETGQDGRFRLAGLQPDEHRLSIYAQLYTQDTRTLTLQPGQALDLGDVALAKSKPQPGTIGIQLRGDSDGVLIAFLQPDSPADHAGLRTGDAIAAVDGQPVQGVDDARVRIRGAPGTPVLLTLSRNGTWRVVQVVRAS